MTINFLALALDLTFCVNLDRGYQSIYDRIFGFAPGGISNAHVALSRIASTGLCYRNWRGWWLPRTDHLRTDFYSYRDCITDRQRISCLSPQYFIVQYQQTGRRIDHDGLREPQAMSHRVDWNLSLQRQRRFAQRSWYGCYHGRCGHLQQVRTRQQEEKATNTLQTCGPKPQVICVRRSCLRYPVYFLSFLNQKNERHSR